MRLSHLAYEHHVHISECRSKPEESLSESQGSQNELLRIRKWFFNTCSGLLKVCSGRAQECLAIAQAKAAAAQVQRRKWKMPWQHCNVRLAVIELENLRTSDCRSWNNDCSALLLGPPKPRSTAHDMHLSSHFL